MEVDVLRKGGVSLPLSQLVEESKSPASSTNQVLETKIYAKVTRNTLIEVEPTELHFGGFQLGMDYLKSVRLINITSDVMNIHIIPTQTSHFQTIYTKKFRLIPGLAYTVKVQFCPDEWRYFCDCIRVHCKGEENLLIPVHAYPVIDDLHIPPRIDFPAVQLGQSVERVIPLSCSCPIDFDFQVMVIQPHQAFSIHPLTGVVPANGQVKIVITFTPLHYETCQVTIQLVVSQFNTKPFLCTITGKSDPNLALSPLKSPPDQGDVLSAESGPTSPLRSKEKPKVFRVKKAPRPVEKPEVNVCTPAGVAKMLIRDTNKITSKDLKEVISCDSMLGVKNRQMKEALFMIKVTQSVKEEQENHLKWQVHLGMDPVSEQCRRQVLEEREIALQEYEAKKGDLKNDVEFTSGPLQLSTERAIFEAGQIPSGVPSFHFYSSFQWVLKQRALRLFQQAARKVLIRCRMNKRLALLKGLLDDLRSSSTAREGEEEKLCNLENSPCAVFPSSFPIFSHEADPLAPGNLDTVPVDPVEVAVTTNIPSFKLQVPQHYKLMGYEPVLAWDAYSSYIPATLPRPLRRGPRELEAHSLRTVDFKEEEKNAVSLNFSFPEALLTPVPAHPLRIFNPAPGLQTYKPTPKYLESDLEIHLCPLPRYKTADADPPGTRIQTTHLLKKFVDRRVVNKGSVTKRKSNLFTSHQSALSSLPRSVDHCMDILPLSAPPPLVKPPADLRAKVDTQCEDVEVQLNPLLIRAQFSSEDTPRCSSDVATGPAERHQGELQAEVTTSTELSQMGKRVMARLHQLGLTHRDYK